MSRIGVFVCHCGENITRTVDCAKVAETLKGDRTKSRITVYYLLAEKFGKLGLFS